VQAGGKRFNEHWHPNGRLRTPTMVVSSCKVSQWITQLGFDFPIYRPPSFSYLNTKWRSGELASTTLMLAHQIFDAHQGSTNNRVNGD